MVFFWPLDRINSSLLRRTIFDVDTGFHPLEQVAGRVDDTVCPSLTRGRKK